MTGKSFERNGADRTCTLGTCYNWAGALNGGVPVTSTQCGVGKVPADASTATSSYFNTNMDSGNAFLSGGGVATTHCEGAPCSTANDIAACCVDLRCGWKAGGFVGGFAGGGNSDPVTDGECQTDSSGGSHYIYDTTKATHACVGGAAADTACDVSVVGAGDHSTCCRAKLCTPPTVDVSITITTGTSLAAPTLDYTAACSPGYGLASGGIAVIPCSTNGNGDNGVFSISPTACNLLTCTSPHGNGGGSTPYTPTSDLSVLITETELNGADNAGVFIFDVTIECAVGYVGAPTVTICGLGGDYTHTSCSKKRETEIVLDWPKPATTRPPAVTLSAGAVAQATSEVGFLVGATSVVLPASFVLGNPGTVSPGDTITLTSSSGTSFISTVVSILINGQVNGLIDGQVAFADPLTANFASGTTIEFAKANAKSLTKKPLVEATTFWPPPPSATTPPPPSTAASTAQPATQPSFKAKQPPSSSGAAAETMPPTHGCAPSQCMCTATNGVGSNTCGDRLDGACDADECWPRTDCPGKGYQCKTGAAATSNAYWGAPKAKSGKVAKAAAPTAAPQTGTAPAKAGKAGKAASSGGKAAKAAVTTAAPPAGTAPAKGGGKAPKAGAPSAKAGKSTKGKGKGKAPKAEAPPAGTAPAKGGGDKAPKAGAPPAKAAKGGGGKAPKAAAPPAKAGKSTKGKGKAPKAAAPPAGTAPAKGKSAKAKTGKKSKSDKSISAMLENRVESPDQNPAALSQLQALVLVGMVAMVAMVVGALAVSNQETKSVGKPATAPSLASAPLLNKSVSSVTTAPNIASEGVVDDGEPLRLSPNSPSYAHL